MNTIRDLEDLPKELSVAGRIVGLHYFSGKQSAFNGVDRSGRDYHSSSIGFLCVIDKLKISVI